MPPPVATCPSNSTNTARATARTAAAAGDSVPAEPGTPPAPPVDPDSFSGATVKKAEQLLKKLGMNPGQVDRQYTPQTEAATKKFQSAVGLDPTGNLDTRTLNAMRRAARDKRNGVQSQGQQSASIKKQERRLQRLGYDTGPVDGVFDAQTAKAVRAFKKDQKIDVNGKLGERGREILADENRALNHQPRLRRVEKSARRARQNRQVTRAAERERADGTQGLRRGDRSNAVQTVQQHLRAAGFDPKHTNGAFDDRTEGMVKQFQARAGLPVNGRVDERTWNKLQKSTIESTGPASPKQREHEQSSAVKRTEKMLKTLGHNPGRVDGLYTERTERAVDAFRRKHGMPEADGVGPGTLRAIRRAYRRKTRPNTNTIAGCAKFLLNSPNVSFWSPLSGFNGRGERTNLERLARGRSAIVRTPDDGPGDRFVKPKLAIMKSLVEMAKRGPIQINALTGGDHSTFSNHYRGAAVDLSVFVGNTSEIVNIARRFGGIRNFERTHIHLDY